MKNCIFKKSRFIVVPVLIQFLTLIFINGFAQPTVGTTSFTTGVTTSLVTSGPCTGGKSASSSGFLFTINSAVNCAINNTFNVDSDGHINLISTPVGSGIWQEGRIASSTGSEFRLNNFVFSALTAPFIGKTLTVTGYRNGVLVPGASAVSPVISATGLMNSFTVDVSSTSSFGNIDEIRLVPSGSGAQGTISLKSITIATAVSTLPVNFQQITAYISQGEVKINFTTSEESNIKDYEIQTGTDALEFTTHHRLSARNGDANHYETTIPEPADNVWIRVKSNEFDGQSKYSKIVLVQSVNLKQINVYPNPASDVVYVNGFSAPEYIIRDLQGRVVSKGKINNGTIRMAHFVPGIYSLMIDDRSFKIIKR
jgi:hypothetical protein